MGSYANGRTVYENDTDISNPSRTLRNGGSNDYYNYTPKYGRFNGLENDADRVAGTPNLIRDTTQDSDGTTPKTEVKSLPICMKPQQRLRDIFNRFGDRTSCIGPGYIRSSQSWHGRIFWSCLFLASILLTCYMTYNNFYDYLSRGTRTSIDIGYAPLQFPMVTICNTNPIRRSRINYATSSDFIDFLKELDIADQGGAQDNYAWSDLYWNGSQVQDLDGYDGYYGEKKDPRYEVQQEFKYFYGQESSDVKMEMGHQIEDMLISCSFSGMQCDVTNFTLVPSSEYGNCYTFNSNSSRQLISRRSGSMYGLQLILYLENYEYIAGLTSGYGGRVAITHSGTMPLPELNGLFISTAAETDIGLKLVNITRLGKPFGVCVSESFQSTKQFKWEYKYTRQACQATCVHAKILEQCKCYIASQIHLYPASAIMNIPQCTYEKDVNCTMAIFSSQEDGNMACSCPNPCIESTYDTVIANRDWPTNSYTNSLQKMICDNPLLAISCASLMADGMVDKRRNFLKVNVFYQNLNYQIIAEQEDYPDAQFLSDLGGSIGLFLGLSLLSLFEIFELVAEIFEWSLEKCCGSPWPASHGHDTQMAEIAEEIRLQKRASRRQLPPVHTLDFNNSSQPISHIRYTTSDQRY